MMLKMSVLLWMLLTVILVSLPIGVISFFFSKKIFKKLSRLLGKIDTFDALVRFKKEIIYIYTTKIASLVSRSTKAKTTTVKYDVSEKHKEPIDPIDEIIRPTNSVSKYADADIAVDTEEDKTTLIKKRKLLEKIIYDAL
ncbi:MAG: hypothetical protein WCP92_00450 [bacterium]